MSQTKKINFNKSILSTLEHLLEINQNVILLGLGVSDPKGFFGTTTGLVEKFGTNRVIECPTSENAYLGHAFGLSLGGYIPIVHFQRMDFMLYAYDQLINNIAKWPSMFSSNQATPLVIRTLVGMGWGQGAQHSQNLAPLLAQVPGLKVVAPSCAASAKGLLIEASNGKSPVIFTEHRWLQSLQQENDNDAELSWKIGQAVIRRRGAKYSIVTWSYAVVEVLRFCQMFPEFDCEVIDLLSLNPLDYATIEKSVEKTGNLILWEPSYAFAGIGGEIIARLVENNWKGQFLRIGYPHSYPSSSASDVYDHYLSLEKILDDLNKKFGLCLKRSSHMKWPADKDLNDWSPWQNSL